MNNKVLLVVLDGWGARKNSFGNAIKSANPKFFNSLAKNNSYTELNAAGKYVGLPEGFEGNSEVGHLHMGAGRLIEQDLMHINHEIRSGKFFKNKVLADAMKIAAKNTRSLHLLGLISDGGVHSHINHLLALIDMAKRYKVQQVYVHAILDGRDVPPKSALKYIKIVEKKLRSINKNWIIGSLMGRFYAMDRDNRWNREHKAYDAMVNCKGLHYHSAESAIKAAYARRETDEFVKPSLTSHTCNVKDGDSVIFFNFRSDRARQLTKAFVLGQFNKFKRKQMRDLHFATLTQYEAALSVPVAYPPKFVMDPLGELISKKNLWQLRIAETEKWAHVTYFFNGLCECIFPWEDRILIPSVRGVAKYSSRPEMSAYKIAKTLAGKLKEKKYSFVLCNLANADMVGHTGDFNATVKAVKVVDKCLSDIIPAAQKNGYDVIITADHGNAEEKKYPDGSSRTAHSKNKVPFILVSEKKMKLRKGDHLGLYDIAPTVLDLMGLKQPAKMKGRSLLVQ